MIDFDGVTLVFSCFAVKLFIEKTHLKGVKLFQFVEFAKDIYFISRDMIKKTT